MPQLLQPQPQLAPRLSLPPAPPPSATRWCQRAGADSMRALLLARSSNTAQQSTRLAPELLREVHAFSYLRWEERLKVLNTWKCSRHLAHRNLAPPEVVQALEIWHWDQLEERGPNRSVLDSELHAELHARTDLLVPVAHLSRRWERRPISQPGDATWSLQALDLQLLYYKINLFQ